MTFSIEQKIAQLEEQNKQLEKQNKQLEEQNKQLEEQNKQFQNDIKQKDKDLKHSQDLLEEYETDIHDFTELKKTVDKHNATIQCKNDEISKLTKSLEEQVAENDRIRKKLVDAQEAKNEAKQSRVAEQQITTVSPPMESNLSNSNEKYVDLCYSLRLAKRELEEQVNALKAEKTSRDEKIIDLEVQNEELKKDQTIIYAFKQDYMTMKDDLVELKTVKKELEAAKIEIRNLTVENESLKLEIKEGISPESEKVLKVFNFQNIEEQVIHDDERKKSSNLRYQNAHLKDENKSLQAEMNKLKMQLKKVETELKEYKGWLADSKKENAELQREKLEMNNKLDEKKFDQMFQNHTLESELLKVQHIQNISGNEGGDDQFDSQLGYHSPERKSLEEKLKQANEVIEKQEKELKEKVQENDLINNALAETMSKCATYENEVEKMSKAFHEMHNRGDILEEVIAEVAAETSVIIDESYGIKLWKRLKPIFLVIFLLSQLGLILIASGPFWLPRFPLPPPSYI